MEWHAGNLLSHTVYTLLFIYRLNDIDPEFIPQSSTADPDRPSELVTVVLRAFVMGLLKSCDLSWRELSKGGVLDVSHSQLE
jgi:N-alpha-acetyltransferase 35, NatC auxiliary subunit